MDNEDIQTQIDDQIKLEDNRAANQTVNVFEPVEMASSPEMDGTLETSGTHVSVFSEDLKATFQAKAKELGITGDDLRGAADAYREISRGLVSAAMFTEGKLRAATEMCVAFAEILEETLPENPPEEEVDWILEETLPENPPEEEVDWSQQDDQDEVNTTNEGNDSDD